MKFLITGFPGTGKSTIAKELKKRGHQAYDPQAMRLMHVESRVSGKRIHAPDEVPSDWYDTVGAYNWDPVKLARLLQQPGDIFVCSLAHNQAEFYGLFDQIFVLTLDVAELENRLLNRPGPTIGKAPSEMNAIISKHESFERSLINNGAVKIDVSPSAKDVADKILSHIHQHELLTGEI